MIVVFHILIYTSLSIIIAYWVLFSNGLGTIHPKNTNDDKLIPGVSVIISYKNAANHLMKTIESILAQDYAHFEVIAIDDFSTDGSYELLSKFHDTRLVKLKATMDLPGKKSALTEAISLAKYDILLFTDADCWPASNQWISSMTNHLMHDAKTEIVLGYSPMTKTDGYLNVFARYETILTAMQYMSYANVGLPYMGVGRNLMYKKSLFERINGYSNHHKIASGDDDLFIAQAATSANTIVNFDKCSFVYSAAKNSLSSYLYQKVRHISTSPHYKIKHQFLLGLFALSQIAFYMILSVGCIVGIWQVDTVIFMLLLKWLIQIVLQYKIFDRLDGKDILWYFPLLDVNMVIYYVTLPILTFFKKSEW